MAKKIKRRAFYSRLSGVEQNEMEIAAFLIILSLAWRFLQSSPC